MYSYRYRRWMIPWSDVEKLKASQLSIQRVLPQDMYSQVTLFASLKATVIISFA
jgi:hypothetical protein